MQCDNWRVESEPPQQSSPSLRDRVQALIQRGQAIMERLQRERPRHASVEVGFRWIVRDKQIAGGVLGGGLAYRLFFWALALALLVCSGLGFAGASGANVEQAATDSGLTVAVANTIAAASAESEANRWWLLTVGAFSFVWFSFSLLRALRLVHASAWQTPLPPLRHIPQAVIAVAVAPFGFFAVVELAGWVRANTDTAPGLVATLAVGFGFAAVWLLASRQLPCGEELPLSAFIPGAVIFGAGLEALHLFTVYFLADRLANASSLYGSLGLAATALFFLFLIGRGLVWAAELNAVVWDVRKGLRSAQPSAADIPLAPPRA